MAVVTAHVTQLRAMLTFERSLVDRVGPPGCAARETAAANVAALEWVLGKLEGERRVTEAVAAATGIPARFLEFPTVTDENRADVDAYLQT